MLIFIILIHFYVKMYKLGIVKAELRLCISGEDFSLYFYMVTPVDGGKRLYE